MPFFCLIIAAVALILPEPGASVGVREDDCSTVAVQRDVDFDKAGEMCRDSQQGHLAFFQSEESERSVFDRLLEDASAGHFWIGLRLPRGRCSNLSLPLRGYEWTASPGGSAYIPSSSGNWKGNVGLCSASCVSVSSDREWTERPCSDKADGFLCVRCRRDRRRGRWHFAHDNPSALRRTPRNDPPRVSDERSVTVTSLCSDGPCEHVCADVRGGYTCSCYDGYAPHSQDPHRCQLRLLCQAEKCPVTVDRFTGDRHCPDGFVESDDFCLDIDECDSGACEQSCVNGFGSFTCHCEDGYVLEDEVKCSIGEGGVPIGEGGVPVAASISPRTVTSSASGGSLVWLWVVIAVALTVILSLLVYWLVKSRRQSAVPPSLNQRHVVVSVKNISC